ncbi:MULTISPECIES: DUF1127 domain-containing protein [unclassified Oleiphilus]|jgi:uncharacterized protein YjiS (DUF1127 family)|uniref:DUF1127 domain-containing protein n=1 Tax=unclassified Oleiphilus TaxID=2631174 RepID=UPI0007C3FC5E|nr:MULTISPECIES: DUF1127 domain-containing protein [unclassified Oleiphilus]KZY44813.1 hypothetical protein A3732_11665 [Oleiphilus sp. HI0050]KZY73570.1 hypothetical protein A3740_18740 [Oleiphilus sp. HI0068]KZY84801.1 hypothetical protein A3743_20560 [Oleiphilus sp. HI0072]KZY85321.1 hypothetical protein A3741_02905 [Oleiphilus sp. HI0069]KZZ12088.1 hypothetical protein A3749_00770 [Oleiphilus sp. HI0078]KZZ19255.1 hypothetical protein A3752_15130 [Oleiphilus sp. HI0081]KZZ46801.1 hypothe
MRHEILPSPQGLHNYSGSLKGLTNLCLRFAKQLHSLAWRLEIHRQRKKLLQLSDAQLRDIGVSRQEAQLEASQPLWK